MQFRTPTSVLGYAAPSSPSRWRRGEGLTWAASSSSLRRLLAACVRSASFSCPPPTDGRAPLWCAPTAPRQVLATYAGAVRRAGTTAPTSLRPDRARRLALSRQPPRWRTSSFISVRRRRPDPRDPWPSSAGSGGAPVPVTAEILVCTDADRWAAREAQRAPCRSGGRKARQALVAAGLPDEAISVAGRGGALAAGGGDGRQKVARAQPAGPKSACD